MINFNQDELEDILHGMSSTSTSAQDILYGLIDETRDYRQEIRLTGSTINSISVNPLYWATKALLGVSFHSNFRTVFGDLCHGFFQFCNEQTINGEEIDIRKALVFAIKKGKYSFKKRIPENIRKNTLAKDYKSFKSMYDEAKPLLLSYLETIHPKLRPIATETRLNYYLTDNDGNPLDITLSGQYDSLEVDCVTDLKTSKTNITGEVVEDKMVDRLERELKELRKKPTKDETEKQLEQNVKEAIKKPSKSELQGVLENQLKQSNKILNTKRSTDEEKAEAQEVIDTCQKQLDEEIQRIETEHQILLQNAEHALNAYVTSKETERIRRIEEIESIVEPIRTQLDLLQYHNDCIEAKKKHGKQLALYALLELLINGRKISKGRVILFVRTTVPKIREFVFDIQDEIDRLIAEIDDIVSLIGLWRSGVSARYLFRPNRESYIGQELYKIIDAIKPSGDMDEFEPLSA